MEWVTGIDRMIQYGYTLTVGFGWRGGGATTKAERISAQTLILSAFSLQMTQGYILGCRPQIYAVTPLGCAGMFYVS